MHAILLNLAGNPALLPEHVDALIAHGDPDVLAELCTQPELTPRQLDTLLAAGGHEALLRLVRSGAMPPERIPLDDPEALLAAVDRPDAPEGTAGLIAACPDPEVRRRLAVSLEISWDFDESTLTGDRLAVFLALARDQDCSVAAETFRVLKELGEPYAAPVRARTETCVLIARAQVSEDSTFLRAVLAIDGRATVTSCPHHPDPDDALMALRRVVVGNWRTPADAVEQVLDATWPALAIPAAGYPTGLSAATYRRLLALNHPTVTSLIAANRGTPPDLIRHLFTAENGRWSHDVRSNTCTVPIDLLIHMAVTDFNGGGNIVDAEGMTALVEHPDPRVRMLAIDYRGLRPRAAAALLDDPDPRVALLAVRHSHDHDLYRAAARRYGPSAYSSLAGQLDCPADLLLTIAEDPDCPSEAARSVARSVARHDNAPPAALDACLRNHPGPELEAAVVENRTATPEQLLQLIRSSDPDVLEAAARHPNLPPRAADLLLAAALAG